MKLFGLRKNKTSNGAWVVAVDMGYGHQRAALPLKDIAEGKQIITANDYPGIPKSDLRIWANSRKFYEVVSRFKKFPVLGDFVFALFDKFQEIESFYPSDEPLESPTLQVRHVYGLMREKAWGRHLIEKLNKKSLPIGRQALPLVATFFIPAFMAEYWGYKGKIYIVIPDTDVSRAWAPLVPSGSNIIYCASTERAAARLARYGVKEENIVQTGFPLSEEFTAKNAAQAKIDLRRRLQALDPAGKYRAAYGNLVKQHLGRQSPTFSRSKSGFKGRRPVHLTFAIGGAGAQAEVAEKIMESGKQLLRERRIELHIIAGIHQRLGSLLQERAKKLGLGYELKKSLHIHEASNKKQYFQNFSKILSQTDILWTKPSELVFYAGLGIPLLIAPPIGSQEVANRRWLVQKGAGIDQKKPELTAQWLPDLIEKGVFAKAAMHGFIEIPKNGTENIKKLVCG